MFLSDFNQIQSFSTDFSKSSKYQISRKFIQWEPRRDVRTDGRTYMTKLTCFLGD